MRPKLVIAYDGTPEAGDGLALGALLADLRGAGLIVARVMPRVGLAIAVALDALVVRPVLLPAAVQVLGRRSWWPTAPRPIQPTTPGGAS